MAVFYYPLSEPMQHKCAQLLSSLAYQRDRLVSRRGSRGLASLTVSARPSSSLPLSPCIAALAAVLSGISTKPKPLELAGIPVGNDIHLVHRTILIRRAGGGHQSVALNAILLT